MYLWDYVADWHSNTIYVVEPKTDHLLRLDSLTGSTIWKIPLRAPNLVGVSYLLAVDQAVFPLTRSYVNAFSAPTGELLWYTELGNGHVSIYVQEEDSLLRIYYGDEIFEISKVSGDILSVRPKDDIVWIQNNVEIHCPLSSPQDGAVQSCGIGLTGIDHA